MVESNLVNLFIIFLFLIIIDLILENVGLYTSRQNKITWKKIINPKIIFKIEVRSHLKKMKLWWACAKYLSQKNCKSKIYDPWV